MDKRWIAVVALAAACTVPDPNYVGESSGADSQAEGSEAGSSSGSSDASSSSADSTDGGTDASTGSDASSTTDDSGTTGTTDAGDGDTTDAGDGDTTDAGDGDTTDAGDGDGTSGEGGDGDGGGTTTGDGDGDEFEYTTRNCDQADPGVGLADVQPIFNLHCIECHSGAQSPFSQDLSPGNSHASLVGVTSGVCNKIRVIPNDPAASYLLDKLENLDLCGGTAMPKNADALSLADRTKIQDWICNGAPE